MRRAPAPRETPVHQKLPSSLRNRILVQLAPDDFALLEPHLEPVELALRQGLEAHNRPIAHAYFLESGIASVVANGPTDHNIEVALIGRDGMTGLPIMLGTDRSAYETYMQVAGNGHRLPADSLRAALEKSASLRQVCLRFVHVFQIQTAHTALANGRAKLEERLARWLLMAHDRTDADELPVTHEFLSIMLGVRRAGVTVALNMLEPRGLVRGERGTVVILDRKSLVEMTNGFYGGPEAEASRLFRRP
jgi:CRP-like cAMP-binding protein